MKIYIDILLLLNFGLDFLLLISTSLLLRRNVSLYKMILGSFLGSLSVLFLFFPLSSFLLLFLKIGVSIVMILTTFGYHSLKYTVKNFIYLYSTSIALGGLLYFLNTQFSYKQNGLVFYHNGLSINYIFLLVFSPILLYLYVKQALHLKNNYNYYYKVNLYLEENKSISLNAYLDTGNVLKDPYLGRPVILVNKKKIIFDINEFGMMLVPYKTIEREGILPCIKAYKIKIGKEEYKKPFLIGLMEDTIHIDGIDCILNKQIMEG